MIIVTRKNLFATKSVQTGRKYLFYRSLTMEATIETPQYKYNPYNCEMQFLYLELKRE